MRKLKKTLQIDSKIKFDDKDNGSSFLKKTSFLKGEKSKQNPKYFININYSSNTKKKESPTKLTSLTTKHKGSKKISDKHKFFDNSMSGMEGKKLKIIARKKLGSSKKISQLDRSGASLKNSRKINIRNTSNGSKNFKKRKESKKNIKQKKIVGKVKNSKLRIVSRDKVGKKSPKSKLVVLNVPIRKNSKEAEKSTIGNSKAAEMYMKLEKLVNAKSRSIDLNKGHNANGKRRLDIVSEDKDQTKYIMNDKPIHFKPKKNEEKETMKQAKTMLNKKSNKYYNYLADKLSENPNINKMRDYLTSKFKQWDRHCVPEFFDFKSSIDFYKIRHKIGKGCFGKVYLATQIVTNTSVALKIIPKLNIKNKDTRKKIEKEVEILKRVNDNKYIIKLFEVFEDKNNVFLVFEYLENGDLVKYFKKNPLFEEEEQKYFFNKILMGIKYIHENSILHRDLKLDNILLDRKMNPKICDFGISSIQVPGKKIFDTGGTPAYLAPEVIKAEGDVGTKSDVWSLGVLLYLLTFGIVPFKANDMQVLYNKIIIGKYKFPECDFISDELINLIQGMLIVNVKERLSMEEVLNHPWFTDLTSNSNYCEDMNRDVKKDRLKREGIIMYLEDVGFPSDYIEQTGDKRLFNHVKACIDSLLIKFNAK